jgi:hypothetical protein
MNRRIRSRTYGGVRGREPRSGPSYSIVQPRDFGAAESFNLLLDSSLAQEDRAAVLFNQVFKYPAA